jgi:LPXTG-motif cell wall-anchored protein
MLEGGTAVIGDLEVLAWFVFGAIALAVAASLIRRRKRRNRRHNLPPPDSKTLRSPDWRRYELHTPRKYIP